MSVGIVFLHGYTSVQMYTYLRELTIYQYTTGIVATKLCEACVPTFFIISGYLFFIGYQQTWASYKYKMKKRFFSLLLPYFFWNGLILAAFYIVECIPIARDLFNDTRKLLHDCTTSEFLNAFWMYPGSGGPILTQLWFVRNLIVLVFFSPIIYSFVRYAKIVGIIILGLWWTWAEGIPNLESSIFYFCLGSWFSINGKSLIVEIRKLAVPLFILFPLILIADVLLNGIAIGRYVHRIETLTCVLFVLALVSMLLEKGKIRDIVFLSSSSFFLYVAHDPMIRFMRKFFLRYADHSSEFEMIALYFITVIADIAIVYAIFWCLQKYAPNILKWTTGR